MRTGWVILLLFAALCSNGQGGQSVADTSNRSHAHPFKPEILSSGFIDILNNGQVNASARLIRLFIGEQGKWSIPLSVYGGVSGNQFQQWPAGGWQGNEQLMNSFINPLSGLANVSTDKLFFFRSRQPGVTRTGLLAQCGFRVLTGYKTGLPMSPESGRPVNFLNSFGVTGLYFQTGAWERTNSRNMGVFWLAGRYILAQSGERVLQELLPSVSPTGFYHGWSIAWGVEINNLVNIKVIYYRYVKEPEWDRSLPIYQFSFHYSLR